MQVHRNIVSPSWFWDNFSFVTNLIIANLIGEFFPYLYHRVSHVGRTRSIVSLFLWKVHAIHYLPATMNWFKTNWMHPVNMLINSFLKLTPLFLLGFSERIVFCVGLLHMVVAYLSHANIRTKASVWDYIIVIPHLHHFHHSTKLEEAKNYGNILPFWDIVFGTYYNNRHSVENVGVVNRHNYPKERLYLKQLIFPFSFRKGCCRT